MRFKWAIMLPAFVYCRAPDTYCTLQEMSIDPWYILHNIRRNAKRNMIMSLASRNTESFHTTQESESNNKSKNENNYHSLEWLLHAVLKVLHRVSH